MKEVIKILEKITKDLSDIEQVYNDLVQCAIHLRSEILKEKDLFFAYDMVIAQIALLELELYDEFDGRVFIDIVKTLKSLQ
jgi:hypothetical protein